jgi:hypothetical protein
VPLLQVLLFVVAQNALVRHGELHALPGPGAAVDEVASEDDAIARAHRQAVEQGAGLVEAAVEVSDDDGSGSHVGVDGGGRGS